MTGQALRPFATWNNGHKTEARQNFPHSSTSPPCPPLSVGAGLQSPRFRNSYRFRLRGPKAAAPSRLSVTMASGEGAGVGEGWEAAVRAEVGAVAWWDDPDSADLRAKFKAFTGQRSDWPRPTVLFWKDLLLRVARRLRICSAPAHLVGAPPAHCPP